MSASNAAQHTSTVVADAQEIPLNSALLTSLLESLSLEMAQKVFEHMDEETVLGCINQGNSSARALGIREYYLRPVLNLDSMTKLRDTMRKWVCRVTSETQGVTPDVFFLAEDEFVALESAVERGIRDITEKRATAETEKNVELVGHFDKILQSIDDRKESNQLYGAWYTAIDEVRYPALFSTELSPAWSSTELSQSDLLPLDTVGTKHYILPSQTEPGDIEAVRCNGASESTVHRETTIILRPTKDNLKAITGVDDDAETWSDDPTYKARTIFATRPDFDGPSPTGSKDLAGAAHYKAAFISIMTQLPPAQLYTFVVLDDFQVAGEPEEFENLRESILLDTRLPPLDEGMPSWDSRLVFEDRPKYLSSDHRHLLPEELGKRVLEERLYKREKARGEFRDGTWLRGRFTAEKGPASVTGSSAAPSMEP